MADPAGPGGKLIYRNDIDGFACDWLRNLVEAGELAAGPIDNRSIKEVRADDLRAHAQCHFFAGVGGWELALRLAGWPPDRPVWTGSCPCQPFSTARQGKGESDPRHLWPELRRLIAECRPPVVFGEQVAGPRGRGWLSGVRHDLEALGYAVGGADLPACCVGEPQKRQRLFWVADAQCHGHQRCIHAGTGEGTAAIGFRPADDGEAGRLADSDRAGQRPGGRSVRTERGDHAGGRGAPGGVAGPGGDGRCAGRRVPRDETGTRGGGDQSGAGVQADGLFDPLCPRHGHETDEVRAGRDTSGRAGSWADSEIVYCADGKWRRVEPGTFPLAHGLPRSVGPGGTKGERLRLLAAKANRTGRLRGYGNAIAPEAAALFVRAYMQSKQS